jgi:hypothetical protein
VTALLFGALFVAGKIADHSWARSQDLPDPHPQTDPIDAFHIRHGAKCWDEIPDGYFVDRRGMISKSSEACAKEAVALASDGGTWGMLRKDAGLHEYFCVVRLQRSVTRPDEERSLASRPPI